ncbi:MAG: acyl carrier protein [Oscillospiraceae bacterium]|nr:acyl carrier protein [Oscillospiraceae bacterium]
MNRQEIEAKITELIRTNIDGADSLSIEEDTMLITGGYIDSFDIVSLISVFEAEFGITLPFDDLELENFDTVSSIADVIFSRM